MLNTLTMPGLTPPQRTFGAEAGRGSSPVPVAIIGHMPVAQLSDEELVARYCSSSAAAEREECVSELFRRNYARVGRWCLRFAADREAAADLAQEVFTKAYQNLASFQGKSKFSTWLFTIARHHCLNAIQARAHEATELRTEVEEDFMSAIPDLGPDPHSLVERKARAKTVREMLNQTLDDTERQVFTLHYGDDVPLEAITRLLGLENQSGAKAYIVSAKRKLARAVQRWKASGQFSN